MINRGLCVTSWADDGSISRIPLKAVINKTTEEFSKLFIFHIRIQHLALQPIKAYIEFYEENIQNEKLNIITIMLLHMQLFVLQYFHHWASMLLCGQCLDQRRFS